jgi:hypothetical protein
MQKLLTHALASSHSWFEDRFIENGLKIKMSEETLKSKRNVSSPSFMAA